MSEHYPGRLIDWATEQIASRCETSSASAASCLNLAVCERSQLWSQAWRLERAMDSCPVLIAEAFVVCGCETVRLHAGVQ